MTIAAKLTARAGVIIASGAALVVLSGFSLATASKAVAVQPPQAMFTLPDPSTVVDLDAYRSSFNRWPRQGGHTRPRTAGSGTTEVTIDAYGWAHASGPNHVPPSGRALLVGHLINHGSATTDMYSLKPGNEAEYFLFITNADGQAAWEMREVANDSRGAMSIASSGLLVGCNHAPASRSEADFKSCSSAAAAHAGKELNVASSSGVIGLIQSWFAAPDKKTFRDDPGWISCDAGCCTLSIE